MQDDQDNGEFPISDNPESNQTSYDDEADARDSRTFQVADHGIAPSPVPRHRRARRTPLLPLARMPRQHHRWMMTTSPYATFFLWCGVPVLIVLLIRIFRRRLLRDSFALDDGHHGARRSRGDQQSSPPRSSICSAATSWYSKIPTTG